LNLNPIQQNTNNINLKINSTIILQVFQDNFEVKLKTKQKGWIVKISVKFHSRQMLVTVDETFAGSGAIAIVLLKYSNK
jgi:hypothetical protein